MDTIRAPLIGITGFCKAENKDRTSSSYNKVNCNYINAIAEAGGQPVVIPELDNLNKAEGYVELVDGFIFSGGQDISPSLYGEDQIPGVDCDLTRDRWEMRLFQLNHKLKKPMLGICRGMQLFNVALGGTLYQDIIKQYNDKLIHRAKNDEQGLEYVRHKVNIEANSRLSRYMCAQEIIVNSYHHQAVKDLGAGLRVSARSEGGVIEAIEAEGSQFLLGVQWHPEDLLNKHVCFKNLFANLIDQSRQNSRL